LTHHEKVLLLQRAQGAIGLGRQCELVDISRASAYYQPMVREQDDVIMGFIDKIYTDYPFYGSRRIRYELAQTYEIAVARDHVRRLMRLMGLEAIYPKIHRGSEPNKQHQKYPYLLKNLSITTPNQVWGTDITYIKLEHGWAYLVAFIDWFSRYVVSWELSSTLDIGFCLSALDRALETAVPEISNSDQGSHFTSEQFLAPLKAKNVNISMDGRGRCMDNIFTERLWRTVKYENVFLKSYRTVNEANLGLTEYFHFYNTRRPHQSLNNRTPATMYRS